VKGTDTSRSRWRPSRAGILNVWRYYDEVFEFHSGRLLLRGPNGTGKSKALELLLPFLFDANLRANRLSTFGSSERTMHWNLMGEGASGITRVGYVWLEFERGAEWFTCGARLQASAHTTTVHADFFTTSQRIGVDGGLRLLTDSDQPLTRAALAEALGERGDLHDSPEDYRAAVRRALFPGLSEQRYDALITALLQLRTPKLSERLDPNLLSGLLSRALPPLGPAELAELAEGFERLDRRRADLLRLDAQVTAAEAIAERQRDYARRVLLSAADEVLTWDEEAARLQRAAAESEQLHERTTTERAEVEQRRTELDGEIDRAAARRAGPPADRERLARERDEAAETAADLRTRAAAQEETAAADAERATSAERGATTAAAKADRSEQDARTAADLAGMAGICTEIAGCAERDRARSLLRAAVRGGHDRIAEVRAALLDCDRAVAERAAAEAALEQARADLAAAADQRAAAEESRAEAERDHLRRLRDWVRSLHELPVDETALLQVEAHADRMELLRERHAEVTADLHRERAEVTARRELRAAQREEAAQQADPEPEPEESEQDRPGAPLWRLVAFRNGVPEKVRAGVEAALRGSGLLEAWVPADSAGGLDLAALHPVDGPSLVEVLRPEAYGPVDREQIWALLHGIAYRELTGDNPWLPAESAPIVLSPDGMWRVAGLTGTGAEGPLQIGAAVREKARERRDAERDTRLRALDAELAELDRTADSLARREERLRTEWSRLPADTGLVDAERAAALTEADLAVRDDAVRRCTERLARAAEAAEQAGKRCTATASEHGMPAEPAALDELSRRVEEFNAAAETWLDAAATAESARASADSAAELAARSRDRAAELTAAAAEFERTAERRSAQLELGPDGAESGGAEPAAAESAAAELRTAEAERELAVQRLVELAEQAGGYAARRTFDAAQHASAAATADAANARLGRLVTALGADAGLPRSTSDDPVELARAVTATWPDLPHGATALAEALQGLTAALHDSRGDLAERAEVVLRHGDGAQLCSARLDGVRVGAEALRERLTAERDAGRAALDEAERELFDKTLTGATRRHLADRIRQAEELVDAMNTRLRRVRTASKVAVQLVWEVDPALPEGTRAARDLLLSDPSELDEQDRARLREFFRERVAQARGDGAGGWEGRLGQVLDYTAWHRFGVKIDRANGEGWQLLTKRLHGALSGGEKAIALHLPLFAAVAAHYRSVPEAPRFILLDEVFVGVDATNRGQVFELLAALDLDLLLTSDHEWCTYRELDGIAVHQLITGDGDDAVTTARFVWDGRGLRERRGAD